MYRTTTAAKAIEIDEWMKEQMATLGKITDRPGSVVVVLSRSADRILCDAPPAPTS